MPRAPAGSYTRTGTPAISVSSTWSTGTPSPAITFVSVMWAIRACSIGTSCAGGPSSGNASRSAWISGFTGG